MEAKWIQEARSAAEQDYNKGLPMDATRHGAKEHSIWGVAYKDHYLFISGK